MHYIKFNFLILTTNKNASKKYRNKLSAYESFLVMFFFFCRLHCHRFFFSSVRLSVRIFLINTNFLFSAHILQIHHQSNTVWFRNGKKRKRPPKSKMSKSDATEEEFSVEKVLNRRVRNGKVSSFFYMVFFFLLFSSFFLTIYVCVFFFYYYWIFLCRKVAFFVVVSVYFSMHRLVRLMTITTKVHFVPVFQVILLVLSIMMRLGYVTIKPIPMQMAPLQVVF